MPFKKGASGNPQGKRPGTKDKITPEIQRIAKSIFDDKYWARVKRQAEAGELHPKIESTLLAYAYGAPQKEETNQSGITVNLGFLQLPEPAKSQQLAIEPAIEVQVIANIEPTK